MSIIPITPEFLKQKKKWGENGKPMTVHIINPLEIDEDELKRVAREVFKKIGGDNNAKEKR